MTSTPTPPAADETTPAPAPEAAPASAGTGTAMSPAECAQQLKQRFPALFGGAPKPLKLRIQADIQARAPGVFSKAVLSAFLRRHTGATSYLVALSKASHRVDLDGQPADPVADEHRQAALEELARRRAVTQSRRAEEDQQRRDRAQLLRDFEKTTLTEANFCALKGLAPEQLQALLTQARQEAAEAPAEPRHAPRHGRPGRPGDSAPGRREGRPQGRPGPRPPRPPKPREA